MGLIYLFGGVLLFVTSILLYTQYEFTKSLAALCIGYTVGILGSTMFFLGLGILMGIK